MWLLSFESSCKVVTKDQDHSIQENQHITMLLLSFVSSCKVVTKEHESDSSFVDAGSALALQDKRKCQHLTSRKNRRLSVVQLREKRTRKVLCAREANIPDSGCAHSEPKDWMMPSDWMMRDGSTCAVSHTLKSAFTKRFTTRPKT